MPRRPRGSPPPYPVADDPAGTASAGQGGPLVQGPLPAPPQAYGPPEQQPPQGPPSAYPGPASADAPPGTYLNPYPPPGAYPGPYSPPAYGVAPAAPGTVYVPGEATCWAGPYWTVRIEELVLQRTTTRNQSLFLDTGGQPLLNSQTNLNFPMEVGLGLDAVCHIPNSWEFEFGYFGLDSWNARNSIPGDSYMVIDSGQAVEVYDALVRYSSAIYLFEMNLRRQITDKVTLLAGFSAGELDEHYSAFDSYSYVDYSTTNALYGFQIGADWTVFNKGPLRINTLCKAGVYGNSIHERSDFGTPATDGELKENVGHVAFLGQIGLAATYEFTPRFSARAYYQAVWLDGVALAPEQIGATSFASNTTTIDAGGSLFYHGGGVGLEFKF